MYAGEQTYPRLICDLNGVRLIRPGYLDMTRRSPLGSLTARRRGILRFAAPAEGADERPAGGAIILTFRPKKT